MNKAHSHLLTFAGAWNPRTAGTAGMGGLPTRPPTISHSGSGQTFEASASSRWTLFTPSFCPEALCPTAEAGGASPALGCSGSGASGQSPRERAPCAEDYMPAGQDNYGGALLTRRWDLTVGSQQPMCRVLMTHLAGTQVTVQEGQASGVGPRWL